MGHYDNCRSGYCSCGAAPGNFINGECQFCSKKRKAEKVDFQYLVEKPPRDPRIKLNDPLIRTKTKTVYLDDNDFEHDTAEKAGFANKRIQVSKQLGEIWHRYIPMNTVVDWIIENMNFTWKSPRDSETFN